MGKHIWIIDDDANICKFLSESLKLKGYRVETFGTAETALEKLAPGSCDLALVDIMLPGMSGIDFCRQLRTQPALSDLPVMLMTAFSREAEQVQRYQGLGIVDCLFKPFTLPVLHRQIATILGERMAESTTEPLHIAGDLSETSFPRLLHNLYTLKTTGLLQLTRAGMKKVIYIRNGYPIFARSNLVRECLGQMMVDDGLISAEQCAESLQQVKKSGRLQGTVLIDMGLLTPHQLRDVLRNQIVEKLLEIFSWPEGKYQFVQGKKFKQGVTSIDCSPAALIYQGISRHYSAARIAKLLLPHRHRYLSQAESPHYRYQEIGLTRRDERVFALCNGRLTLEEISNRFPLARTETDQLLAALLLSEMVESREVQSFSGEPGAETISAEEHEMRKTFLAEYSDLIQRDYFKLFAVGEDANKAALRKAYFSLAKKYHPDRYLQMKLSEDLRGKINELFQRIGEAYETLSDPVRCKNYRETLKQARGGVKTKVEDILRAETAFQKGRHMIRSRNFSEALKQLQISVDNSPEEPEYITLYAWALYRSKTDIPGIRDKAVELLQRSAVLNGEHDLTHLYLGQIFKDQGREREAEKQFELAIQCNPDCTEALRELRLFNLRREKEDKEKKGGLFGRLKKR
ncbi:hypothetical protein C2E25_13050 [Geothermobacter hydrogeniphilus]|uniref:Response regulator n=1 Tax=Geothermobacter hydrogeniphilus TaxID=1969733 RepID=A0A2K2H7V4_9BACT|nr:response regulator [Geothermobacter hydrogeniphilus]PNU19331.1 hypothetical protein C2E25_13050 [Geothermobacter hydrogeniphilus]